LKNCHDIYLKNAIRFLRAPNVFELLEYIEDTDLKYKFSEINEIHQLRHIIFEMIRNKKIIRCNTRPQGFYSDRYLSKNNRAFCRIEPAILKYKTRTTLIRVSNSILNKEQNEIIDGFTFMMDPYRRIVAVIKSNSLMGIIDLRTYSKYYATIRFPFRFREQTVNCKTIQGMTELKYFSILAYKNNYISKKNWLHIKCIGCEIWT